MNLNYRMNIRMNENLASAIRLVAKQERRKAGDMARLILERDKAVQAILTKQPKTKGTKA
jgi:hypothetical protein